MPSPRCQVAIIVGGRVIAAPIAEGAIYDGMVQISFTTRARADRVLQDLRPEKSAA